MQRPVLFVVFIEGGNSKMERSTSHGMGKEHIIERNQTCDAQVKVHIASFCEMRQKLMSIKRLFKQPTWLSETSLIRKLPRKPKLFLLSAHAQV